jgi:hypothetical protein
MGERNRRMGGDSGYVTEDRIGIVIRDALIRESGLYDPPENALPIIRTRIAMPRRRRDIPRVPIAYRLDARALPGELGERVIDAIRLEHFLPILAIREKCSRIFPFLRKER